MPEFLERRLRREARKKGFTGKRADAYVYGGMNDMGAMHGSKITAKGRKMEQKHEADMKSKKDHGIREIRIEVHRSKGKITGHTVHHHMVPKPSSKSHAFYEDTTSSFPFSADDHKGMMAHVHKALNGSAAEAAANANANEIEDTDEEEDA